MHESVTMIYKYVRPSSSNESAIIKSVILLYLKAGTLNPTHGLLLKTRQAQSRIKLRACRLAAAQAALLQKLKMALSESVLAYMDKCGK
jgi:hypothetical protein